LADIPIVKEKGLPHNTSPDMKNHAILFLAAAIACLNGSPGLCATSQDPRVIYGDDNRLEYYQVADESLRLLSESTVVLVNKVSLTASGNGFDIDTSDTLISQNVCTDEPFADQPTPGYCSGFLVAPNIIVTAGHCVSNLMYRAVVFGFRLNGTNDLVSHFEQEDVYYPTVVVASSTGNSDWAVIRLDRNVVGRSPLSFRSSGKIPDLQHVAVMGYPVGLPLKIAAGAYVRENNDADFFVTNTDTYGGNSGSAIINMDTYEVEGVLVRGETDFVTDSKLHCERSKVCSETGCSGEDCTRSTEWSQIVLDYEDPTATPTSTVTPSPTMTPTPSQSLTPTASPTVYDDHGNNPATATVLEINSLVNGSINYHGDPDFFVFNAINGALYSIETYAGTLLDSFLTLYGPDGNTLLSSDSNEGVGSGSEIIWTATETSVLFVKVETGQEGQTGSYSIRVSGPCESQSGTGYMETDLNQDGRVDADDLIRFVEDFGTIYPTPTPVPSP
jgi:hypothetical protein